APVPNCAPASHPGTRFDELRCPRRGQHGKNLDGRRVSVRRNVAYRWSMAGEDENDPAVPGLRSIEEADASRQVAAVTGMSADSAATFASFLSGRRAPSSAFRDAA